MGQASRLPPSAGASIDCTEKNVRTVGPPSPRASRGEVAAQRAVVGLLLLGTATLRAASSLFRAGPFRPRLVTRPLRLRKGRAPLFVPLRCESYRISVLLRPRLGGALPDLPSALRARGRVGRKAREGIAALLAVRPCETRCEAVGHKCGAYAGQRGDKADVTRWNRRDRIGRVRSAPRQPAVTQRRARHVQSVQPGLPLLRRRLPRNSGILPNNADDAATAHTRRRR